MIRRAEAADLPAIMVLEKKCFPNPYEEDFLTKACTDEAYVFLVDEEDAVPLGYILAQRSDAYELLRIAVGESYRKTGVGRRLLARLADRPVVIEVAADNATGIAFYERCGFVLARVRRDYYGPGQDGLVCIRSVL